MPFRIMKIEDVGTPAWFDGGGVAADGLQLVLGHLNVVHLQTECDAGAVAAGNGGAGMVGNAANTLRAEMKLDKPVVTVGDR